MLELAKHVAGWSKDPSTGTGCVLVRPDRTVASLGYNGLPRSVVDDPARLADRSAKLAMTVHAEANAIIAAREHLDGCTAYVYPWPPCCPCTGLLIQAGARRIVAPPPTPEQVARWGDSFKQSAVMLTEAGVALDLKVTA